MSEKITFKQLVELIAKQSKQNESSANSFIHELVQIIEGGLKKSGTVSISGFGKFELRWMKERPGVNPQTGDEITIPGQNKVVFKPYKALRETVNKPFANLEPEVLSDTPESKEKEPEPEEPKDNTEETDDDPFGLKGVFGSEEDDPFDSEDPFDSDAPFDSNDPFDSESPADPNDPFEDDDDLFGDDDDLFGDEQIGPFKKDETFEEDDQNDYDYDFEDEIFASDDATDQPSEPRKEESVDDLIIERENPHFGKKESEKTVPKETETAALPREEKRERKPKKKEEPKPEKREKIAPVIQDESKMAREVQKSGSFKWSYAAAVIIVMIALIILFLMMQRSDEPVEETASTNPDQTEQVIQQPSASDDASDDNAAAAQQPEETVDEESPPANSGSPPPTELETQTYSVQSGQSLWDIAESQLGNPYLWPVIYHLNEDLLDNPNQLLANASIEIPTFSDPDNLSEFEREQVALGYFSLYQWNRENNPDEARYFLWAVGVFSQDLLAQPPSQVDSQDLAFARNR